MCGIVAAVSSRNIVPVLVQGLQRLEYRGYDSCGVAVHSRRQPQGLQRARSTARVAELMEQVQADHIARRHRHCPHALGHPRRAGGAQRPPALQPRPGQRLPTARLAAWRWCTTASSKTTTSCAPPCRPRAMCF
jgi:glucosamine 6-phosphate synthetase-like amidotransferase/phosphosugar isomerase protein